MVYRSTVNQPVSVWDIKHLVDQQLKALQTPEVDNTLY